ncbi:C39 family peptidase [Candidatus Woesearchaeota archaeon]|nr:C39 family peptidase [Candidatus Woesearchaeota archaeon]
MRNLETLIAGEVVKLSVPHFRQEKPYSCGAASLRTVFAYYGLKIPEREIRHFAHTDAKGTDRDGMLDALKAYDFCYRAHSKGTLHDIVDAIHHGYPAIVDWRLPDGDGHFSVLYGYGKGRLYIRDPYCPQRHWLSPGTFLAAWKYDKPINWYVLAAPGPKITVGAKQKA